MVSQGYATGDLDKDAWSVRYFAHELGLELMVTQSYSKNFGLYGTILAKYLNNHFWNELLRHEQVNALEPLTSLPKIRRPLQRFDLNLMGEDFNFFHPKLHQLVIILLTQDYSAHVLEPAIAWSSFGCGRGF